MYMKLTWTTILIFDVHFDVQFNGTPQMRDAVLILNHSIYVLYHSPNRSASLATSTKKALVDVTFSATTTRAR